MKNIRHNWLNKAAASVLVVLSLMTASAPIVSAQATEAPTVYAYANPVQFNPTAGEWTNIYWYVSPSIASLEVDIYDGPRNQGGTKVRDLIGLSAQEGVTNPIVWNGRVGDQPVPNGTYYYYIDVMNSQGTDSWEGTVSVVGGDNGGGGTTVDAPVIGTSGGNDSSDYASPNPFDPNTQTTSVFYSLSEAADVTITFRNSSNLQVDQVTAAQAAGSRSQVWDGRNSANQPFPEGVYSYEIFASNEGGNNTEQGTVEIAYVTNPVPGAPVVTFVSADPMTFDPQDGEATTLRYTVDRTADVQVDVLSGSNVVATVFDGTVGAGQRSTVWDGRRDSDNNIAGEGPYTYRVTACTAGTNSCANPVYGYGVVDYDNNGGGSGSITVSGDFASPNPFDPYEENTRVYFTLSNDADVTVTIWDDNGPLRTLVSGVRYDGNVQQSVYWDGEDPSGEIVDEDEYQYRILACPVNSTQNCDLETGDVEVNYDNNGGGNGNTNDLLTNIRVYNEIFDPRDNEEVEVCFDVEEDNTDITIEILDGSYTIDTLVDDRRYDRRDNLCFQWDGEDDDGRRVADDVYQIRVFAENGNDRQVEFIYTEVDTDGIIIGFPTQNGYCGGFRDVPADSPFCRAIELMSYRGVFEGYPDGTFRPYDPINRAETAKVILLALEYHILADDGSNLGYWDVIPRSWYMRYLRTAQREGVATGYPDRSFRPGGTVNRVELLRMFLEASEINVPHCNVQPYADTPINVDTRWYIDYACFAKAYGLMSTDANGNFRPADPMTRGDVAMLFYQFERRGLFAGYNTTYYNNYYTNGSYNNGYYYTPYDNLYNNYNDSYYYYNGSGPLYSNDPYYTNNNYYNNSYYYSSMNYPGGSYYNYPYAY